METRLKKNHRHIKTDTLIKVYLLVYLLLLLFYIVHYRPLPWGEWDDYALPTISIINELNFSISSSDVEQAKIIYADWAENINNYSLSGYKTRAGGEMSWYFPTYSFACVPFTILLYKLGLPAIYAFPLTNIAVIIIMSCFIWKCMKTSDRRKLALIVLLTANPIVFYFGWASAESFIFAMIGMALVSWHNKWWKRAAIFISIAGSLNPVVMIIGMAIILDYFITVLSNPEFGNTVPKRFQKTIANTIMFGCCFIISIIPMIYNYYNIHAINLTAASISGFTRGTKDTILGRFFAYLFDLNFGILPYYGLILIMAIMLIPFAIIKQKWRYLLYIITECGLIAGYSIMTHINCGMSGIARYNSWGAVIMVFAVCCFGDAVFKGKVAKRIIGGILATSAVISSVIVYSYGPWMAIKTSYLHMTPIAKWFLTKSPDLYNPLHSTFASRVEHRDGGYNYSTPIAYFDDNYALRKLLVSPEDKESVLDTYYFGIKEANAWLFEKIDSVSSETYISVPSSILLEKIGNIKPGELILFTGDDYNASSYFRSGVSSKEQSFSWTDGKEAWFKIHIDGAAGHQITGKINISGVFNGSQRVQILVDDEEVLHTTAIGSQTFVFSFAPESDIIEIKLELPDAISPLELGQSGDGSKRAIQLLDMSFDFNN